MGLQKPLCIPCREQKLARLELVTSLVAQSPSGHWAACAGAAAGTRDCRLCEWKKDEVRKFVIKRGGS